ncbi:MAG: oligosaccharide flippase family protein [Pseudomonadota bacterium]
MRIKKIAKDKKRLVENFLSLSALQVATYLFPLITLPYLVKVIGSAKYGVVAFAWSFNMFFQILIDFGFDLSATKDLSIYRDNKQKISELFSSVMVIKLILTLTSFIILITVILLIPKFRDEKTIHIYSFLMIVGLSLFPAWFFQGLEKMKYITVLNILMKTIFLILIFIFIKKESDYVYIPLLSAIGEFVALFVAFYEIFKRFKIKFYFPKYSTLIFYFKGSLQFFLSRISVSFFNSSSVFVLGFFVQENVLGCFAISQKLYGMLKSSYQPIVRTLYPYIAHKRNVLFFQYY